MLAPIVLAQTLLTGVVTGDSSRPIAGAIVEIASIGRTATTNGLGLYTLLVDRPGAYSVGARALGYASSVRAVRLGSGGTLRLDFALGPILQELAPLVVTVEEPLPTGIMRGFEERRRMGFGRFITRDMLDRREHDNVAGMLHGMAGVRMVRRPMGCGGGFSAATGRGIAAVEFSESTTPPARCSGGTPLPTACYMSIYVDGIRMWAPGTPDPPDFEQMRNNQYEGVEVYRGLRNSRSSIKERERRVGRFCCGLEWGTRSEPSPERVIPSAARDPTLRSG